MFAGVVWNPVDDKNELIFGTTRLKVEVVLFACNTLVTLIAMLLVTELKPMGNKERERADSFHERLRIPIGKLQEDQPPPEAAKIPSPFFVVGISVLLIGLLMVGVQPWVKGGLASRLNLGLAAVLIAIGGLMAWRSRGAGPEQLRQDR